MFKKNLLYLLLLAGLFYAFVSVLDENKAKAESLAHKVSYDGLRYQWVVAEVKDIHTGQDLTTSYQSKVFQFLNNGGFIEFKEKMIYKTGSWNVVNNRLEIQYDDSAHDTDNYQAELVRPEELLLLNENLQLRLLRLRL